MMHNWSVLLTAVMKHIHLFQDGADPPSLAVASKDAALHVLVACARLSLVGPLLTFHVLFLAGPHLTICLNKILLEIVSMHNSTEIQHF